VISGKTHKHLLAHGPHFDEFRSIEYSSTLSKASLWGGHRNAVAYKVAFKLPRNAVNGMTLRHRRLVLVYALASDIAGCFILCKLGNPANVTLITREWLRNEGVDEANGFLESVLTGTDGNDVGIVVLTSQLRSCLAPHQCRTNALDLVGGNLLAITGTTKDDAESLNASRLVGSDRCCCVDTERGIVI